LSKFLSLT